MEWCEQCSIYAVSVALQPAPDKARLLAAYHAFHALALSPSPPLFRCLVCGTAAAPLLPRFLCALCGSASLAALSPPSSSSSFSSSSSSSPEDARFAARLAGDVDLEVLRATLRMNGVRSSLRAPVWQLLLGYTSPAAATRAPELALFRRKYAFWAARFCRQGAVLTEEQERMRQQIAVDVPRTSCRTRPEFFDDASLAGALSRVLFVWSAVCFEAVGYFQGLNDLATPLFVLFSGPVAPSTPSTLAQLEADVCWSLALLLEPVVRATRGKMHAVEFTKLEEKIARAADAELCTHLEKELGIDWMFFAFRWNICLLAREFPLPLLYSLWDFYLLESEWGFAEFHPFVVVALLMSFRERILKMDDTTEALLFLQNIPTTDWDERRVRELIASAIVLRQSHGHLVHLQLDETRPVQLLKAKPLVEDFTILQ